MLEDKNDNLQNADGKITNESETLIHKENPTEDSIEVNESNLGVLEEEENGIALSEEEIANDSFVVENENDFVINAIADVNAEESEDETIKGRHDIPMEDYDAMTMEKLVEELEKFVVVEKVMSVREHVEEIKKAFLPKYYHFIEEKKDEFFADNPDSTEDFSYHFPLKAKFDTLYTQYKDKKGAHFKSLQNDLKSNLANRLAIVEELKNLVNDPQNITVS